MTVSKVNGAFLSGNYGSLTLKAPAKKDANATQQALAKKDANATQQAPADKNSDVVTKPAEQSWADFAKTQVAQTHYTFGDLAKIWGMTPPKVNILDSTNCQELGKGIIS